MTFSGINAKYLGGSDDLLSFMWTQLQASTELHLVEEMRGEKNFKVHVHKEFASFFLPLAISQL